MASACTALAPQAIVVGDVTSAGVTRQSPTAEAPVYYAPVIAGYQERGAAKGGTKPPAEDEVVSAVVGALAREHYLMMKPGTTPDIMLVIWWGMINPQIDEMEHNVVDEVAPTRVFVNTREMMALIGAFKGKGLSRSDWKDLKDTAQDDRYFILVAAYDYAAAERKERKLLWTARMSTESTGRTPDEVFPLLAASGAAAFGRDTAPTLQDTSDANKIPKVELAPFEVIEVLPGEKKP